MDFLSFHDFFPDDISHGFFGRQGGVSTGVYDSLNCSTQSRDDPDCIAENRTRVLRVLGGQGLSTLKQIHSSICYPVENSCMEGIEEGDALVTRTPGQVIGCLTADCGPVLFYGADVRGAPIIGAAHAGWGGALKGVLESTMKGMLNLGAELSTIKAAIGPCIAQASYEVDRDFIKAFIEEDPQTSRFFDGKTSDKAHFDLQGYIQYRLVRAGVLHIVAANQDTYAQDDRYFSYRRATHRGEMDYGRQISALCIRKG
jgi:YfiH family protein